MSHPPPSSWLKDPTQFGKGDPTGWKVGRTAKGRAELAAARIQHRVVRACQGEKARRGMSTKVLARKVGITPEALRRLFRGDVHMSQYHAQALGEALGIDIKTSIAKHKEAERP